MNRRELVACMAVLGLQPSSISAGRKKPRPKQKKKRRNRGKRAVSIAQVDAVLRPLAELMWHGEDDEALSIGELEKLIAGGRRVTILCTDQAVLAVRALTRAGISARLINPFYAGPWGGESWGHTAIEVKAEGRWQVLTPPAMRNWSMGKDVAWTSAQLVLLAPSRRGRSRQIPSGPGTVRQTICQRTMSACSRFPSFGTAISGAFTMQRTALGSKASAAPGGWSVPRNGRN